MFMQIKSLGENASKLSYSLIKHPFKLFKKDNLTAFYSEFSDKLVEFNIFVSFEDYQLRDKNIKKIDGYITDRNYALSSLFCRELKNSFHTAIFNNYKEEELKNIKYNLEIFLSPIVTNLSKDKIDFLFIPLGYEIETNNYFENENNKYKKKYYEYEIKLKINNVFLNKVLMDLLILIPVIDNYSHFNIVDETYNMFEQYFKNYIISHPLKEFIYKRFLRYKKNYINKIEENIKIEQEEDKLYNDKELYTALSEMRYDWFYNKIKEMDIKQVFDIGCGSGKLLEKLQNIDGIDLFGYDCSDSVLKIASRYVNKNVKLLFGSLIYFDESLLNKECFILCEVIEHLKKFQLDLAINNIFNVYKPKYVLISTPNQEYNKYYNLKRNEKRHSGHIFEWKTNQFLDFANKIKKKYHYKFKYEGIGHYSEENNNKIFPTNALIFEKIND